MKKIVSNNGSSRRAKEQTYLVENIIDKKIEKGVTLYLIKWQGYGQDGNTWEPTVHLTAELIAEFENGLKQLEHKNTTDSDSRLSSPLKKHKVEGPQNGFERGLKADKILGITEELGEVKFVIMFEGGEVAELVPACIANVKCPQLVIRFYEERLFWENKPGDDFHALPKLN